MTTQSSRRFAIGVQSFPVMRQGGFVYVDKMHHVWQLSNCFGNYILLSRPRRFGKSLLCSTFKAYFEGRRELFEDLRIAEMDSAWRSHAVLFFDMSTLKDIDALSESLDDALPLFYQSGNLTIKHYDSRLQAYRLAFPNREVRTGLFDILLPLYAAKSKTVNDYMLTRFANAIAADDIDGALTELQQYLLTIPYDLSTKSERDFLTIFYVLFGAIGIRAETEVRNAVSRSDVVLHTKDTTYVMELKLDGRGTVDDALQQIDSRNYLIPYYNNARATVKTIDLH